jgi:hypothetical protein
MEDLPRARSDQRRHARRGRESSVMWGGARRAARSRPRQRQVAKVQRGAPVDDRIGELAQRSTQRASTSSASSRRHRPGRRGGKTGTRTYDFPVAIASSPPRDPPAAPLS